MKIEVVTGALAVPFAMQCAEIHASAFTPSGARGWTVEEFTALLARNTSILFVSPDCFLLADFVAGEAEILSIAVHPDSQRQGRGRALIEKLFAQCTCRKVSQVILEVAVDNHAAIDLYKSSLFKTKAIRPDYFKRGTRTVSAAVMTRLFGLT